MRAVENGHDAVVNALLDRGAEVNTQNNYDITALMLAAYDGKVAMVEALLDRGAEIETQAKNGYTALISAATQGHVEVVNILLDRNANVDNQLEQYKTVPYVFQKHIQNIRRGMPWHLCGLLKMDIMKW